MAMHCVSTIIAVVLAWPATASARVATDDSASVPWNIASSAEEDALSHPIVAPGVTMHEAERFTAARVSPFPMATSAAEWEQFANRTRHETLERVVYRGEAAVWRYTPARVEWLDSIVGGPGYRIRKLRYEALPGLWIPALLYEPEKLKGRVPVMLAVNGHDRNGKAAPYKQTRCINLAKRGMLALNLEWLGMGQLRGDGFTHSRMNQLDLCGTSGLSVFYLAMKRGLDVLLTHEHADPERVAVSGLSGGGWQTIILSSLDTRVTLANPVAGYSGFQTRTANHSDLGDSEQTPVDLGLVADYTVLTALRAPRPTLLTYNAKDDCCFAAAHALPPLMEAAGPIYKLYGKFDNLRSHVNETPGTHNFEQDNREALYAMLADHFFAGREFAKAEIACPNELKTAAQLDVPLPAPNANFNSLAIGMTQSLPRQPSLPASKETLKTWQEECRARLREIVRLPNYAVEAESVGNNEMDGLRTNFWKLHLGNHWTLPAVELSRGEPTQTVVLFADAGRKSAAAEVKRLLEAGRRVIAIDLFYFGECRMPARDYLFALLIATVGDRPIGVQAAQVSAVAKWCREQRKLTDVGVAGIGPRSSTIALVAGATDESTASTVELTAPLGSLKQLIAENWAYDRAPELFCFGLLESFDAVQLAALVAPRTLQIRQATEAARKELESLSAFFSRTGGTLNME